MHTSYYRSVEIQFQAKQGPERYQVDSQLAQSIVDKSKGERDGRLSNDDVASLVQEIKDGGVYGKGEKVIARALLAARDDRNTVTIDGQRIRMPAGAEKTLTTGLQQFWGSLAHKGSSSSTQQAVGQFSQQITNSQS